MDKVYKAISDATRRMILKLLRERERTAGELAGYFDLAKPTLSRHFTVLREAGLITQERHGRRIIYRMNADLLEQSLLSLMEEYQFVWSPPIDVEQAARQLVESMERGDFESVVREFDEALSAVLSVSTLRETWARVIDHCGPFVKQSEARIQKRWQSTTVVIPCEFAVSQANVRISFDRSGSVCGLLILERLGKESDAE